MTDEVAEAAERFGDAITDEDEATADNSFERMQAELQSRRHAEVASSASQSPEQLCLLILACAHDGAVGSDDLGADQVVACQAVLRGEVADSTAKGEERQAS